MRENAIELPKTSRRTHPKSHEWFTGNILDSPGIRTNVSFEAIYRPAGFLPTDNNVMVSMETMEKELDLVEVNFYQYGECIDDIVQQFSFFN